jgi:hypothetical protein
MHFALALLAWLAAATPAQAKGAPVVTVVRDLTLLPPAKYRVEQSSEEKSSSTEQYEDGKSRTSPAESFNRLTYAVELVGPPGSATTKQIVASVERVQVKMRGPGFSHDYDSADPLRPEGQGYARQFRYLVGGTGRVDAAAFADGAGFAGIDTTWDRFDQENRRYRAEILKLNRDNYGDARVDRMFTQELDVLFGPNAGRAKGKSQQVRAGDQMKVTLTEAGIRHKPTPVEHAYKVLSATADEVVVQLTWKLSGFDPHIEVGEVVMSARADVRGTRTITFVPRGGLVTRVEETIERVDQVAPGLDPVVQFTSKVTQHTLFSMTRR